MKNIFIKLIAFTAITGIFAACDFWAAGIRVYEVNNYQYNTNNIANISISFDSGSITVMNTDDPYITIVMSNFVDAGGYSYGKQLLEDNNLFTVTNINQTITVTQNKSIKVDYWNVYGTGTKMYVYLPFGMTILTQKIITVSAQIEYFNANYLPYLKLAATSGNILLLNANTGRCDVEATSGNIDFMSLTSDILNVACVSGNIHSETDMDFDSLNVKNASFQETTGNIKVKLDDIDYFTAIVTTGNANFTIGSFYSSSSHGNIECTSGNVTLKFSDSALANLRIDASVTTGNITKGIEFDKVLKESGLTSPEYSAQNGSGSNPITVKVTTGNIDLND